MKFWELLRGYKNVRAWRKVVTVAVPTGAVYWLLVSSCWLLAAGWGYTDNKYWTCLKESDLPCSA